MAVSIGRDAALRVAVKAINHLAGANDLVPSPFFSGAMPRLGLPTDDPTTLTFEQAVELKKGDSGNVKTLWIMLGRSGTDVMNRFKYA